MILETSAVRLENVGPGFCWTAAEQRQQWSRRELEGERERSAGLRCSLQELYTFAGPRVRLECGKVFYSPPPLMCQGASPIVHMESSGKIELSFGRCNYSRNTARGRHPFSLLPIFRPRCLLLMPPTLDCATSSESAHKLEFAHHDSICTKWLGLINNSNWMATLGMGQAGGFSLSRGREQLSN